jgi:hypothetical protein
MLATLSLASLTGTTGAASAEPVEAVVSVVDAIWPVVVCEGAAVFDWFTHHQMPAITIMHTYDPAPYSIIFVHTYIKSLPANARSLPSLHEE